jgi:tryptophanyl-tRNA synthetase
MQNLRIFAAAGMPLDNPDAHIYRQSYVPAHSELTIILNSFSGFGEISRMVQFKEKSQNIGNDRVSVGLFDYPVLMAADILLYDAVYIPVGDDQTQHLEFTRDISERMNNKFGDLFTVPKPVKVQHTFFGKDQGLRIMDLQDPTKKMSKSDESGKGIIFLSDTPEDARKKIMSAATDSLGKIAYDPQNQPGLANLLDIYELLGEDKQEFIGHEQYGPFKAALADRVAAFLEEFQARLSKIDDHELQARLETSEAAMNEQANAKLLKVQKAVGLR